MRRFNLAAAAAFLLLATGCSSAPPAQCSDCDPKVEALAQPGGGGNAAAAAAAGGQQATSAPTQDSRWKVNPYTFKGSGHDGDTNPTITTQDAQTQAGAPAVTQSLVNPTSASAQASGGVSPAVHAEQEYQADLRAMLLASQDPEERKRLSVELRESLRRMAAASVPPNVTHLYYQPNAKTVNVAVGRSVAGGGNPEGAADRMATAAEVAAMAEAVRDGSKAVMDSPEGTAPAVPPAGAFPNPGTIPETGPARETPKPAPNPGPEPPAGPLPNPAPEPVR